MIPQNALANALDLAPVQPTHTHQFHMDKNRIKSYAEGQLAMKQAIYLILCTERFQWLIYSHNYGIELADLMGKPIPYCLPEIKL